MMVNTLNTRLHFRHKPTLQEIFTQVLGVNLLHQVRNLPQGEKFRVVVEILSDAEHMPDEVRICTAADGVLLSNDCGQPYFLQLDCTRTVGGCTGVELTTHVTFDQPF